MGAFFSERFESSRLSARRKFSSTPKPIFFTITFHNTISFDAKGKSKFYLGQ